VGAAVVLGPLGGPAKEPLTILKTSVTDGVVTIELPSAEPAKAKKGGDPDTEKKGDEPVKKKKGGDNSSFLQGEERILRRLVTRSPSTKRPVSSAV